MNIGFDAKRAFHNSRGLGNYSRDTIRLLTTYYPENNYFLFNPSNKNNIAYTYPNNTKEITPNSFLGKTFSSLWRSKGICKQIKSNKLDVFHGLSQELPLGIKNTGVKSIVTMHDAIFMRYPELYSSSYRTIFIQKNKYACKAADRIIAISEQTKEDIIQYFNADERKIDVVYQGCNNIFREPIPEEKKDFVRKKYNLPETFILNVGAIEKRKNVELIIEALHQQKIEIPLVVIGKPTDYINELNRLIEKYKLNNQVQFIHNAETVDLPAIYSLAQVFVYPSIFEGFGIPILEALCTSIPTIASTGTCFEEVGGASTIYVSPQDAKELGISIARVLDNVLLRKKMIADGLLFSEKFTDDNVAKNLMNVYVK